MEFHCLCILRSKFIIFVCLYSSSVFVGTFNVYERYVIMVMHNNFGIEQEMSESEHQEILILF